MSGIVCHDFGANRPDLTVMLDEDDARASRIVFHDKDSEDRGLPALELSTTGVAVDEVGNSPTSECFRSLLHGRYLSGFPWVSTSGENTGGTRKEEGKRAEASRGT